MSRRSKKNFNIGDVFSSWVVTSCVDEKKYLYLCECECGSKKTFNKYNLLRGRYSICKNCNNITLKNLSLIKKHWNCELNGAVFTKPQDFNLTHSYWFLCESGHNFKSSIKDFSLNRCLSCQHHTGDIAPKIIICEYTKQLLNRIFNDVTIDEDYYIIIGDINAVLHLIESDRHSSYRLYYSSEKELVDDMTRIKMKDKSFAEKGYKLIDVKIEKNFKKNIDIIERIMLQLIHKF